MPHSVDASDHGNTAVDDERQIKDLLAGETRPEQESFMNNITERPLEPGEKADDAIDFEDMSDDELPDEEATDDRANQQTEPDVFEDDDHDDLFGDHDRRFQESADAVQKGADTGDFTADELNELFVESRPAPAPVAVATAASHEADDNAHGDADGDAAGPAEESVEEDPLLLEQRALLESAARGEGRTDVATLEEIQAAYPCYDPTEPPPFSQMLLQRRVYYVEQVPLKTPKPFTVTRAKLEPEPDSEILFRVNGTHQPTWDQREARALAKGVVLIEPPRNADEEESESEDDHSETPSAVGGLKWQDLVSICQDWTVPDDDDVSMIDAQDAPDAPDAPDASYEDTTMLDADFEPAGIFDDEFAQGFSTSPPQGRKRKLQDDVQVPSLRGLTDLFEDPEKQTRKLAKRVKLDMNDSHLMFGPITVPQQSEQNPRRMRPRDMVARKLRRFNISNDEAYELLNQNRQSKTRAMLGSQAIEHSTPALRLQYPFYKQRLSAKEARAFHRPLFNFDGGQAHFEQSAHHKRKNFKNKSVAEIFKDSPMLSQGDNSNSLFLEYSEEYPIMLSNFGMGTRIVNYYRREAEDDTNRPKMDIGETETLMPQDKSPFAIFGDVEPGQMVPTVTNGMYRAPVFRHKVQRNDFLLVSSHTGVHGRKLFLKLLENLHVVGQQFPHVEVPKTSARKVGDLGKKRLRALANRLHHKYPRVDNEMISRHLTGFELAQVRSKMREVMEWKNGWVPKSGEAMDKAGIQSLVKPEEVCLLDSTQVGEQAQQDAGYQKDDNMESETESEPEEKPDSKVPKTVEQKLAPWETTKNFLNAASGKAMVELHGDGDPTGRGEAFNFIKTSMKGGFKGMGESAHQPLTAQQQKELGGHAYNVANQQKKYNDTIKRIWEAQKSSLSSTVEPALDYEEEASEAQTPVTQTPVEDDTASAFGRGSAMNNSNRVLQIVRETPDKDGNMQQEMFKVYNPKVIREYMRRRKLAEINNEMCVESLTLMMCSRLTLRYRLTEMQFTGDARADAVRKKL